MITIVHQRNPQGLFSGMIEYTENDADAAIPYGYCVGLLPPNYPVPAIRYGVWWQKYIPWNSKTGAWKIRLSINDLNSRTKGKSKKCLRQWFSEQTIIEC